jgi:hypothetical protein
VEALAREQAWPDRETTERIVYGPERRITAGFQWLLLGASWRPPALDLSSNAAATSGSPTLAGARSRCRAA